MQAVLERFSIHRPEDVEDAVQEICAACLLSRHRFRGLCRFDTWLGRVAEYTAIDYARKHLRQQEISESQLAAGVFEGLLEASARADEAALHRQAGLHDWLESVLERLPPRQRQVARLYFWESLSCPEIAERLDLKPQTVRAALHFGLRACRRMIALSEAK
ncbi:MAG: sigma-70 family RNA polymerase sigma factor [Armatimonadetes bacterium]|nr:sigma-70 family RNA polymerase sigma factor [Armatimonadota bacterium]